MLSRKFRGLESSPSETPLEYTQNSLGLEFDKRWGNEVFEFACPRAAGS